VRRHPLERDEGLVDRAVVTVVEHQDFGPARDVARQPDTEAVGIRRRERKLPEAQAEAPLQLAADPYRVGGGQHKGGAAGRLPRNRLQGWTGRHAGGTTGGELVQGSAYGRIWCSAYEPCLHSRGTERMIDGAASPHACGR
jgi:hypothetical protein